jgi:hypothetical protein
LYFFVNASSTPGGSSLSELNGPPGDILTRKKVIVIRMNRIIGTKIKRLKRYLTTFYAIPSKCT